VTCADVPRLPPVGARRREEAFVKILTAVMTLPVFAVFLSWTLADVTCAALGWPCFDDPCVATSTCPTDRTASALRLPSALAERN
jgi:hypothetical protein